MKDRYVVQVVHGFEIDGDVRQEPPRTHDVRLRVPYEACVLDTAYSHTVVESFAVRYRSRLYDKPLEQAAALCARLNAEERLWERGAS